MNQESEARGIAAIVLAAGGSARLGHPKQLITHNGVPLVRRAAQAARDAGAERVIVVLGANAQKIERTLDGMPGVEVCVNPDWNSGLASSLRSGLARIREADFDAVLVTLADQPHVDANALKQLISAFSENQRLVAAQYNGVIGVPAVFGKEYFGELSVLTGDAGAGKWLRERQNNVRSIPVEQASVDIDTQADEAKLGQPGTFRWRGRDIARIEALSDAVFGFAVTLLVVSLEVPHTFSALKHEMRGFVAFAICFSLLVRIWHEQHMYFRRYGMQDTTTTVLNCMLLFVILFYVYPLKFMFTMLVNSILGGPREILVAGVMQPVITPADIPILMIIFGIGYMAVFLLFCAMYIHAYRARAWLSLTELEIFDTRESLIGAVISASVALASILFAAGTVALGVPQKAGFAGMLYPILLAPALTIFYTMMGIKRRKLQKAS